MIRLYSGQQRVIFIGQALFFRFQALEIGKVALASGGGLRLAVSWRGRQESVQRVTLVCIEGRSGDQECVR